MTTDEWLNDCINEKWVEKMIGSKFHRFFLDHYNESFRDDVIQEVYIAILTYPPDKLYKVVNEHPKSFLYKVLKRIIYSKTHPVNKKLFGYNGKVNKAFEPDQLL